MPGCCAVGCSNSSGKGFLMKRFPRDPSQRKIWAVKVKRENWIPTDYSSLCEVHFTAESFEQNRADGKKSLKRNAIPTLFDHIPHKKSRKLPTKMSSPGKPSRFNTIVASDETLKDLTAYDAGTSSIEQNTGTSSSSSPSTPPALPPDNECTKLKLRIIKLQEV